MHVQSFGLAAVGLPIRRLSGADLAACVELAADRGWPPEQNKWRLLFAVGEAYGVDDPAGGLAAMAVLTRYGRQVLTELFGFAERVLVAEDSRGTLAGFAAAWRNEDDLVIGPLVAADLAVARPAAGAI